MARFANPVVQYLDNSGNVLAGGKLYFYESGTTTLQDTFADSGLTTANPNPVVLDGAGRVPNIFLVGTYNVVLTDQNDTQIWARDPVADVSGEGSFADWDPTATYGEGDIVTGSDGLYYISLQAGNFNNDPTNQPSAFWVEALFIRPYNATATYREGEPTIGSDGLFYISQVNNNTNNDPTVDDGSNWQPVSVGGDAPDFTGITISKTDAEETGITYESDDDIYWQLQFNTNEDFSIDRWDGTGSLIEQSFVIDTSTGDMTFTTSNVTFDGTGQEIIELNSAIGDINEIQFSDAGTRRWAIRQEADNDFVIAFYNAGGSFNNDAFRIDDASEGDIYLDKDLNVGGGNINTDSDSGFNFLATNALDSTAAFDFDNVVSDASVRMFENTTASGTVALSLFVGDGTSTETITLDGTDGSLLLAADESGVKIRKFTLSTSAPSGGSDGDVWMRYTP